jgi:ABC-type glycerol-3-phosphate transport system substrate-binding protein
MQLQQQATVKDGAGNIQVLGIDPLSEDATFGACSFFAQAWGTQYFDEKTFTYNFDNTQLAEAMTTVKKLYDLVGGPAAVDKWRKQNAQWVASTKAAIPAGTQNMSIIGYFAPAQVADFAPNRQFAFTWPAVPASKKGYKFQTVGSHNLLIPAGSKHVPEAFQLMGFLIGDTAEQVLFDHSGFLGARLSFLKKVDTSKYPGLDFYFQSVQNADNVGGPLPDPVQSFSATTWTSTLNNVLAGKAQPADALKQLQQQVTTEYHQRFPNG